MIRNVDIVINLRGYKLGLKRLPRAYIASIFNHDMFVLRGKISNTTILEIKAGTSDLLYYYIYLLNNDSYLRLVTAAKTMLLRDAGGYIPSPLKTPYSHPRLSISAIRGIVSRYIENPEKAREDLVKEYTRLSTSPVHDWRIRNYIAATALHTIAHTLYLASLAGYDASTDDIGLIMKKNPGGAGIDARIILYEKGDGGLGFFTDRSEIQRYIREGLENLLDVYRVLDEKLRQGSVVGELGGWDAVRRHISSLLAGVPEEARAEFADIYGSLEKLSRVLLDIASSYGVKGTTILPAWLIRYGLELSELSDAARREFGSRMWPLLSLLFDVSWDASPDDLIMRHECVYYDLIQYFALSRRFAIHFMEDALRNYRFGGVESYPLIRDAGELLSRIDKGAEEHVFFTPWIDEAGARVIRNILDSGAKRVYLVVREPRDVPRNLRDDPGVIVAAQPDLHAKHYANTSCETIATSMNLTEKSMRRNVESLIYIRDCIKAKAVLARAYILSQGSDKQKME